MVCQPQPFADLVTLKRESICSRVVGVAIRDETPNVHRVINSLSFISQRLRYHFVAILSYRVNGRVEV
jgi:hypothetical protein